MAEVKKKPIKRVDNTAIVSSEVKSHANDPFVIKKVEKAREMLRNSDLSILKND